MSPKLHVANLTSFPQMDILRNKQMMGEKVVLLMTAKIKGN